EASYTLSFQFPKLSFFFKENERFTGKWEVLPIGLHPAGIDKTETPWHYSDIKTMVSLLKPRGKFSHKGTFGHALLVAGSYGKMGAAVLAAKGCLRSGVGLLTIHIPKSGNQIVQISVPEAMVSMDESENLISHIPISKNFKAIGIGPGIGKGGETAKTLRFLIKNTNAPLVIDADALNLLSENPEMIEMLPEGSVLTPHPLEFERLAGHAETEFERLKIALNFAKIHRIVLILKGAYTAIVLPDGKCWFNSTGNPGMATGGSGDVLTGILTGLLAQGYTPGDAARLGVYIHGLSGDLSLSGFGLSEESLLASDIANQLGRAFEFLKSDPDFGKTTKKSQF
ncbi:MAG TPA: NAD(P)H-hydrate dehydratase, partial [Prolixibacteraceae bacterium]